MSETGFRRRAVVSAAVLGALGGGLVAVIATKAVPKMMTQMMSGMMGSGEKGETPMMGRLMLKMMPQCVEMVLPETPEKERRDYVLKMVSTLMEHGSVGMSEEEKGEFAAEVVEKVRV